MIIRTGFVSNSSSTSFLLGVPKEVDDNTKILLKIFAELVDMELSDTSNGKYLNKEDYITTLNAEINSIKEETKELNKGKKEVELLLTHPDAEKLISIWNAITTKESPYHKSQIMKWSKNIVQSSLDSFSYAIKRRKEKIKEMQNKLNLVNDCSIEDTIVSITMDNWRSKLENQILLLIEKSPIKVLERTIK